MASGSCRHRRCEVCWYRNCVANMMLSCMWQDWEESSQSLYRLSKMWSASWRQGQPVIKNNCMHLRLAWTAAICDLLVVWWQKALQLEKQSSSNAKRQLQECNFQVDNLATQLGGTQGVLDLRQVCAGISIQPMCTSKHPNQSHWFDSLQMEIAELTEQLIRNAEVALSEGEIDCMCVDSSWA